MEGLWLWSGQRVLTSLVAVGIIPLLLSIAVTVIARAISRSKHQWPPGPWGWPLIGSIPSLGRVAHKNLAELANKYGPLMYMKLGSANLLVASTSEMAQEFLKTHDKIWASRFRPAFAKIVFFDHDVVFSEYGPQWRYIRKLMLMELLCPKQISAFQGVRKEEILRRVHEAIDTSGSGTQPVRLDVVVRKIAMSIVTRMTLSEGSLSEKVREISSSDSFQETIDETFKVIVNSVYPGDFLPWLDRVGFDPQGVKKKYYAVSKKWDTLFQTILDDRKKKNLEGKVQPVSQDISYTDENPKNVKDVVDVLLTRPRDVDGQYLTEREMKAILMDIIFGSADTGPRTLKRAFGELLRKPHVLQKAQQEMDSVVGRGRLVQEVDLPSLPYLNAIVKETFRLYPAGPLLPHMSTEDCEIRGYKIPAGTRLFVNVYAIHRDPEMYERPLEFDPDRFLHSDHEPYFELLPFGCGRRMCPGRGLALLMIMYIVAVFIQTCTLKLPANMRPEDVDLDTEEFPLQALVAPRLAIDVLQTS